MSAWRGFWRRALSVLFIASAIGTLWPLVLRWLHLSSWEGVAAVCVLGALVMFGSLLLVWQEYRYARKARYAEALHNLHEFARHMTHAVEPQQVEVALHKAVAELSEAFTLITGTRVAACLKKVIWVENKNRCKVEDVCRDPKSGERADKIRKAKDGSVINHWVDTNTAFKRTWIEEGRPQGTNFYLCNDLASEHQYENTSFLAYGEPVSSWLGFARRWTLPYESTIVVPIVGQEKDKSVVLGYIALDSSSRHVFDARYDVPFLRIVAEFIGPALDIHLRGQVSSASAGTDTPNRTS